MSVRVKICGLTDELSVRTVIEEAADFAGFVYFPKSPRHVGVQEAARLRELLPASIPAVSVLVDPEDELLRRLASSMKPDYFQLHGNETPERVLAIKTLFPHTKLIKAIKVRAADDVAQAMRYTDCADMLMFDAKPPELPGMLPGGNGLSFDWALLKNRVFSRPWILSGGLNVENITDAIHQTGAQMVDVSSGVEHQPGVKDPGLIRIFIKAVHRYDPASQI